jgi:FKBP-type peptidyl-prolyl cis-trans isomerase FklB
MKQLLFLLAVIFFTACSTTKNVVVRTVPPPAPEKPTVATETDSISYAIGVQVATFYKNQGLDTLNYKALQRAFEDVYNDSTPIIDLDQANMTLQEKLTQLMAKKLEKEKLAGEVFLDSISKKPNVVSLPSGLLYEIIKRGDGPIPKSTDTVSADYVGTLTNGEEFDNSYKRGKPLEIPVTGVIKGWVEALQLMPVGSKWKLYIPSDLAYGDRGAGGAIPGGAALVFTIELLNIVHH